jgi:hypothetical protein
MILAEWSLAATDRFDFANTKPIRSAHRSVLP